MSGRKQKARSDEQFNPMNSKLERPKSRRPKEEFNSTRKIFDKMDESLGKPKKKKFSFL